MAFVYNNIGNISGYTNSGEAAEHFYTETYPTLTQLQSKTPGEYASYLALSLNNIA